VRCQDGKPLTIIQTLITGVKVMIFVGIDVGCKELVFVIRHQGKSSKAEIVTNTFKGHQAIIKKLKKLSDSVRICVEATGVYHLDLVLALSRAHLDVMVINPKASHNFAKVLMKRTKTDNVDAEILAQYAERMDFTPWQCPSNKALEIRACSRHLEELSYQCTRLRNQIHAMKSNGTTPVYLLKDNQQALVLLEKRIVSIRNKAVQVIGQDELIKMRYELLLSIKGIAQKSAVQILGELLVLPKDMSARQWVAHTGLDPRQFSSGSSVNKKPHLSKAGNQHLRRALFMPALSGVHWEGNVKAYYMHLVNDNGLKKIQAVCAVMRKLLHAIYGMFKVGKPFDGTRFYKFPSGKAA